MKRIIYKLLPIIILLFAIQSVSGQEYLISNSTISTDTGYFYDTGGPEGDYDKYDNTTYIMTFYPQTEGKVLQFVFEELDLDNDLLYVYDGSFISSPLIGSYNGYSSNSKVDTITATNADGALTFKFQAQIGSIGKDNPGWKAIIDIVDAQINDKPNSFFIYKPISPEFPLSVKFTDTSCNYPATWHWDFGDGNTSIERHPSHNYAETGIYLVTLVTTNSLGTDTISRYIKTGDVPEYRMSNNSIATDLGFFYDDGGPTGDYGPRRSYTLTFHPGTQGKFTQVIFEKFKTYNTSGIYLDIYDGTSTNFPKIATFTGSTYNDTVTATNGYGALTFVFQSISSYYLSSGWEAIVQSVDIENITPPNSDFAFSNTNDSPFEVQFNETCTNYPISWEWDFGDGNTSTERNPNHIYAKEGVYEVTLVVHNQNGSNSLTKLVATSEVKEYYMTNSDNVMDDVGYSPQ